MVYSVSKAAKEPRPRKEDVHSSDDDSDSIKAWWAVIGKTPEDVLTSSQKSVKHAHGDASNSPIGQRGNSSGPRYNPGTRNILSKHPSAPVVVSQPVEGRSTMSSVPSRSVGERLGYFPNTPPQNRSSREPPSTDRTKAITQALESTLLAPNKGKEKMTQPQFQRPGLFSKPHPIKTVVIDDDDDDDEVSDMFAEPESLPSTRPGSLFDYDISQQSLMTPASSWSPNAPRTEGSWSSVEVEVTRSSRPSASGRGHHKMGAVPKIETKRLNSPVKPRSPNVVSSAPSPQRPLETSPVSSAKDIPSNKPITVASPSDAPKIIPSFFHGILGADLETVEIAHSSDAQKIMDELDLAWGVQYELARGVSLKQWTWDDVCRVLQEKPKDFQGSNAEVAFKVGAVMLDRPIRDLDIKLWQELDHEQAAIIEGKGRGLGLMGEWQGQGDWFGGRIQQIARLARGNKSPYQIYLEPMEKRRSHRFARFCGSRRILQLRIPKQLILEESAKLKTFLQGKFVLCGRVFVPFHAKDHSLYMVETNEDCDRNPRKECGDESRLPFANFINWHNPPEYNYKQALSKYVTRFALGLSTTIPVIEFEEKNMFFLDDIYGSEYLGGKALAEETMTDGCGFINQAALVAINTTLNKPSLPVAIQGRIAGAKGLWVLHPYDKSSEFRIWVRDSQNKIKFPGLDRAHRIFELVTASQPSGPVSISRQSIVNLSFNGIPDETLTVYLEKGLTEEIEPLVNWDRPNAGLHLWYAINSTGGVAKARLARVTTGISRALGLTGRLGDVSGVDLEDGELLFDEPNTSYAGRNEYSKAPLSLNECALELVQAGFHPSQSAILRDKLHFIIQQTIKSYVEKYRIPLTESLDGFVIPDPLGILEEGEIYYRSSQSILDPRTQRTFDIVTGDVVLGRYPIRVASDLQKVKAVNRPELYQWPDVIIASTKGSRSLASYLSGGDMDGDNLFMLREPELVEPFINKPLVHPPENLLEVNFQKHVETVDEFCERVKRQSPQDQQTGLQSALLLSLNEDRKGLYSVFHDKAIENYGYDHPKAIRLAYMFNTLLDASKSGLILADGIFEKDQNDSGGNFASFEDTYFGDPDSPTKRPPPSTNPSSAAYILTKLERAGEAKGKELLEQFSKAALLCDNRMDAELMAPYELANTFAHEVYAATGSRLFAEDLSKIRQHVHNAQEEWARECQQKKMKSQKKKKGSSRGEGGGESTVPPRAARLFASPVEGIVATRNVEEIKASYAYTDGRWSPFAFQVAFGQLCEIKARAANSGLAPCVREIDEMKTIVSSCIKAVAKSYGD